MVVFSGWQELVLGGITFIGRTYFLIHLKVAGCFEEAHYISRIHRIEKRKTRGQLIMEPWSSRLLAPLVTSYLGRYNANQKHNFIVWLNSGLRTDSGWTAKRAEKQVQ